jgi:hypothetical protein
MFKSWLSTKFQPHPIIHVSRTSILKFWSHFSVVTQLYFILLNLSWKFTRTFSYPYQLHPPNFGSIYSAIIPQHFFLDSGQRGCLWSKCYFGKSKWHETSWASSYPQIIGLCKILAQVDTLCEWYFKIGNSGQCWHLNCKYHLHCSIWAENWPQWSS